MCDSHVLMWLSNRNFFSDLYGNVALDLFALHSFLFLTFSGACAPFSSLRINEATDYKDHKMQVASCLISLKVEPSPALSINLSGAPLIKIVLTHVLVRIAHVMWQFHPIFFISLLLLFKCSLPVGIWVWDTHLIRGKSGLSVTIATS